MDIKINRRFNEKELPDMKTIKADAKKIASNITIGETLFMKKYGVNRCYYGHIHGRAQHGAFCGERDGILFELVACDFLGFSPKEIN